MYRSSPFRSTLNTGYITCLGMCKGTEAVHSVALCPAKTAQTPKHGPGKKDRNRARGVFQGRRTSRSAGNFFYRSYSRILAPYCNSSHITKAIAIEWGVKSSLYKCYMITYPSVLRSPSVFRVWAAIPSEYMALSQTFSVTSHMLICTWLMAIYAINQQYSVLNLECPDNIFKEMRSWPNKGISWGPTQIHWFPTKNDSFNHYNKFKQNQQCLRFDLLTCLMQNLGWLKLLSWPQQLSWPQVV